MEELDIAAITKRSIHGVFALATRSFFITGINFVTFFVLTVLLSPTIMGIYYLSTAIIAFLAYFSDIGLAAALIQKKEEITETDLNTTFYLQQALVITVSMLAVFAGSWVKSFYKLNNDGLWLYYVLVFSFFVSSLKTIPSIQLERVLRFDRLVIPQVMEAIFFDSVVLVFAIAGWGVKSFVIAIFARDIAGLIAIYVVKPWRPRFLFSKIAARHLLSFGIPFQANSVLALVKDNLLPLLLGKILPLSAIGYIGFAQKWTSTLLRIVMDNIIRITFPSFSRLQHEKEHLAKSVEKSLFASCLLIFPALLGLTMLFPLFIHVVPKYLKWEPALISLGFFAINGGFACISTPLTNALNAIGKITTTLKLMVFWTVATYALTFPLVIVYGFNGVAAASALVAASSVATIFIAQKYISFSAIRSIQYPFISAVVMGIVLYVLKLFLPVNWITISMLITIGASTYIASLLLMAKKQLMEDMALIKRQFIK